MLQETLARVMSQMEWKVRAEEECRYAGRQVLSAWELDLGREAWEEPWPVVACALARIQSPGHVAAVGREEDGGIVVVPANKAVEGSQDTTGDRRAARVAGGGTAVEEGNHHTEGAAAGIGGSIHAVSCHSDILALQEGCCAAQASC